MKSILAILSFAVLFGCSNHQQSAYFPDLPEGLKDCKVYNVRSDDNEKVLHVVRCPNSSTTAHYQSNNDRSHVTTYEETVKFNQPTTLKDL